MITKDFITWFSKTIKQHDGIMVVVDKLNKVGNLIPIKSTYKLVNIGEIFMREIFRLHGMTTAIYWTNIQSLLLIFGRECLKGWVKG